MINMKKLLSFCGLTAESSKHIETFQPEGLLSFRRPHAGRARYTPLAALLGVACFALFLSAPSNATIYIDVNAGTFDPVPVAIMDFTATSPERQRIAKQTTDIIKSNLTRSGLFRVIPPGAFIEKNLSTLDTPTFADWSAINARVLVIGSVNPSEQGRVAIEFRLWDISIGKQIRGQIFMTEESNARRIGHIISDIIYKELSGDEGYFDTRILYVAETGPKTNRTRRLALMDQDGHNLKYLTNGKYAVSTPTFSPTAQQIAYVTYYTKVPKIFVFDIETGRHELVGDFPGMSFAPRFSPDGKKLIVSIAKDGASNLHELDLRSKQLRQLTRELNINTAPSYSPDQKRIAFISDRSGTPQIYIMSANGGRAERISFGAGRYEDVVWSPRGDYLAFTKIQGGKFSVGVMFDDGTGERIIADGFMIESPSWSPNGRRIIYYEQKPLRGGDDSLIIHSVDVTGLNHEIIKTETKASDPAWSPLLK
ncbi:MAG: Tol-Pal system beta propeller repeat protein TolB [Alphaproteobacteria bacterium]|nr:Tol-Pal system beta propeller repeat protein TolB [Alphaproteobacteria bacterium]